MVLSDHSVRLLVQRKLVFDISPHESFARFGPARTAQTEMLTSYPSGFIAFLEAPAATPEFLITDHLYYYPLI